MGEVAICGGSEMVFRVGGMEMAQRMENQDKATGSVSSSAAIWERFLPKMVVRVLLVEADYSTRQIIAALLRKCGYRVVAVGDGLTAWEILRGRPSSVDLILTEVDVPLISGYALLTLIMDHEICKKISVIMMSPHDKVSSVYKCMSKGATDFLVKPVRKNELNNLWQHVWRKQASSNAVGLGLVNGSVVQKMDRGTAENKAASYNNSSQCVGCVHQSRESTKKSTDAQSSCTKPESGNDGDADHLHTSSHLESSKCSDACTNKDRCEEDKALQLGDASGNSSTEVINSTAASNNHPLIGVGTSASDSCSKEVDVLPQLDSLVRRPLQNCLVNEPTNKRPRLNHSESSPFSRYINKALQLGTSDDAAIFANQASEEQKHASMDGVVGTRQGENTSSHSPNRELSDTVRGVGIRYENAFNEDSSLPSDCQTLSSLHSSNSIDHTDLKHCDKLDNMETGDDVNLISGAMSHHQSTCSVSNGNIISTSINIAPPQCSNEEGYQVQSSHLHIFSRREAALTKFRLKRKDRCFEKKIRYESRKKLADQRPRVKGQFVRHVASVTTHGEISGDQLRA